MKTAPLIGISRHRLATDGEGITTLVAFHGCALHCNYCLNSQSLHKEGIWRHYDTSTLYEEVKKDELYFLATNGGITFGGGEPYLRSDFIIDFRKLCGPKWLLTLETSLNVPTKNIEKLLPIVDHYIVDIKDMNDSIYKYYTGTSNKQVINNLHYLIKCGKKDVISVRIPLIPLYNNEEDRERSIQQLKGIGLSRFDLFTYVTY